MKFKKLIPALCMLLVAAVLMGTSTFAWFSMNDTVTATGMSVTVKADQVFLEIAAGHAANADAVQAGGLISATATTASAVLYPAAHQAAANTIATADATTTTGTDPDTVTTMTNWYYRTSSDPSEYMGTTPSAELPIEQADFGKYVLVNEFSLTVADGSNAVSDLKVDTCTITTSGDQAVKVLVATSSASQEFSGTGGAGSTVLRSSNLTSSDVEYVKIYVYWDGNDTDVFSNGIADLVNTSVVVTFTGTLVAA
ncbi:MAG: hypothetical protein IKZ81_07590 [Clostridia bacterium]|nr:hypothetical protein [Clostridia bacterium]